MTSPRLADRMAHFDSSGIRKVFDLASKMTDPINLSIGQPDFDVPEPVRKAAIAAIESRKNGYSLTQGAAVLRDKLQAQVDAQYAHDDRQVLVTSGTSGGLVLTMLALVNPGDEVIFFDPYFVMYQSLVRMAGGKPVIIDTYPDFRLDLDRVEAAITSRTKIILLNSPANPTGAAATGEETKALAELAQRHQVQLVSDEIYRLFSYDAPFVPPASFNPQTLVIDGFSKSYGMTGWRIGFAHGPNEIITAMTKLQQYTFVCAPHPLQCGAAAALDVDMGRHIADYRRKRDRVAAGLSEAGYELVTPAGAFYAFPKAPWGTGTEFVAAAIERQLLVIPGNIFSRRDTHFRLSYAADDATIERGLEVLRALAQDKR